MTVTERIGSGRVIDLPPEAGDQNEPRFQPNDAWLGSAPPEQQQAAMWRWFATHYESPVTAVPHDDKGDFMFLENGPFHADQVLHDRFDAFVPSAVVTELIETVQSEAGNVWASKSVDLFGG